MRAFGFVAITRAVALTASLMLATEVRSQEPPPAADAPQAPKPAPSPSPKAPRRRAKLKLNVDRQVKTALEKEAATAPPRFRTSVEVVGETPTVIFEQRTRGLDLECAPAGGGGAPTVAEMRDVRPSLSPSADLGGLAKFLAKRLKGKGPERYFLYRITREGGSVSYAVRGERIPDALLYNQPTVVHELLETFKDSTSAAHALRRLEKGLKTPESATLGAPPPWATTNCVPKQK